MITNKITGLDRVVEALIKRIEDPLWVEQFENLLDAIYLQGVVDGKTETLAEVDWRKHENPQN